VVSKAFLKDTQLFLLEKSLDGDYILEFMNILNNKNIIKYLVVEWLDFCHGF